MPHLREEYPEVAHVISEATRDMLEQAAIRRREAYRLRTEEQLSIAEIGKRLGVSAGRVSQYVHDEAYRLRHQAERAALSEVDPFADRLTQRTYNGLKRSGITTVEQARAMTDDELLDLRNFGVAMLGEVRAAFGPYDPSANVAYACNWVGEFVPDLAVAS